MNQITKTEFSNVYEIVEAQEAAFSQMLSDDSIKWQKESQFAMQALQNNEYLNKTAWDNRASLQNAIINVAAIGITLNPASKHAYLVPRAPAKGQRPSVCLDISYIGLMHLAQKTGSIMWGQAKLVYQTDTYTNTGIDTAPHHNSNPFVDSKSRGPIVGAYCTVKTADGSYLTEEMNIDELNKVRASSKAQNGPWKTWPEEMMRKTVVKRASKYWPKVERLDLAIEELNQHEGLDAQLEKEVQGQVVVEVLSEEQISAIMEAIADANMSVDEFCNHKKVRVESLESFPVARFEGAMKWLESQKGE